MRIKMLRGTGYNGQSLDPGQEYEVDEKSARIFIQLGKAHRVEATLDVVEMQEPAVRHRDPAVRRAARR